MDDTVFLWQWNINRGKSWGVCCFAFNLEWVGGILAPGNTLCEGAGRQIAYLQKKIRFMTGSLLGGAAGEMLSPQLKYQPVHLWQ